METVCTMSEDRCYAVICGEELAYVDKGACRSRTSFLVRWNTSKPSGVSKVSLGMAGLKAKMDITSGEC